MHRTHTCYGVWIDVLCCFYYVTLLSYVTNEITRLISHLTVGLWLWSLFWMWILHYHMNAWEHLPLALSHSLSLLGQCLYTYLSYGFHPSCNWIIHVVYMSRAASEMQISSPPPQLGGISKINLLIYLASLMICYDFECKVYSGIMWVNHILQLQSSVISYFYILQPINW